MSSNKTKKLINKVHECERESNEGLVAVNPGLSLVDGYTVVVRTDAPQFVSENKVVLISGGGSGHEPGHAGFVGKGMLTACACGSVFASPPPLCIMAAVNAACQQKPGCDIIMIIAGAMAEMGKSFSEMVTYLNTVKNKMGTIGLCLSPCSVPGSAPTFTLEHDEMELGLGVHGEAGIKRMKVQSAKEAVKTMMDHMTNKQTSTHIDIKSGDRVALMINNLGGTSVLELNLVAKEAISYLESKGVSIDRAYCGSFLTSLEMAGVSISVLHVDDTALEYLDFPTDSPAWRPPYFAPGQKVRKTPGLVSVPSEDTILSDESAAKLDSETAGLVYKAVESACEKLLAMEGELNDLDKQSGDNDTGSTLGAGAKGILGKLGPASAPTLPVDCPHALALTLGHITETVMGGSSGALYSLFFTGAANELKTATKASLSAALSSGLQAIMKYGGAKPGFRTMVDPLHAAVQSMADPNNSSLSVAETLKKAAEAATKAAADTKDMDAQAGRASYVNKSLLNKPDPGAVAVASWLAAVVSVL
ncbi:bifunctional ATP-dependent dihydroxyacetone kinase/FAD-AMP lyase (Cyclizing) [Elysia marginata]|uniref:Triokinase/FMN cyclase n=1 Tax=Elysia marginata TaxID=1093978 RepID=A0AAV4G642_9GAST|nr:bifunctional ATP-dependent dihydroxyacetone kinase/FAD-AMP lyase (Cyclizing) [Elysia marginata]